MMRHYVLIGVLTVTGFCTAAELPSAGTASPALTDRQKKRMRQKKNQKNKAAGTTTPAPQVAATATPVSSSVTTTPVSALEVEAAKAARRGELLDKLAFTKGQQRTQQLLRNPDPKSFMRVSDRLLNDVSKSCNTADALKQVDATRTALEIINTAKDEKTATQAAEQWLKALIDAPEDSLES